MVVGSACDSIVLAIPDDQFIQVRGQFKKAYVLIMVTLLGMVTDANEVQD